MNLKVAEQYIAAFANLAKTNNTLIVPSNLPDLAGLVATAMTVFKAQRNNPRRPGSVDSRNSNGQKNPTCN